MADRAPDDAAKHVTPAFISRDDAVHDEERAGADVIGDHLQRIIRQILCPGLARCGANQVPKQVDLVVGVNALQHRRDALQAHSGVDRRLGQRMELPGFVAVELHEDEIPDLDVAVAFGLARAWRAAGDAGPVVVEDLAARPARAGIGHLPEIIALVLRAVRLVADADATALGHADLLRPEIVGLVVLVIHRRPQAFRRQLVHPGQQVPRVADRVALEVIAE